MPFVTPDRTRLTPALRGMGSLDAGEMSSPDFWEDTVPAAFRMENIVGSSLAQQRTARYVTDPETGIRSYLTEPGFDPLSDENLDGYRDFHSRFVGVLTTAQSDTVKANIDREMEDRQTLEESGGWGFAAMLAAGVLDPTVLVPVAGSLKKGASLLSTAAHVGLNAGIGTAVQEVGLLATQDTRTPAESALNIAGATFLGGILGAGAHSFLKTPAGRTASTEAENNMVMPREGEPDWSNIYEVQPVGDGPSPAGTFTRGSVGDAAVPEVRIDNPGGEWLANKRAVAEASGETISGPITASFADPLMINPRDLVDVPGSLGENPVPGTPKYDAVNESIQTNGYDMGPEGQIVLGVNHRGEAFIVEGNNRAAAARANNVERIPVDVRWYSGGEETADVWTPSHVRELAQRSSVDGIAPRSAADVGSVGAAGARDAGGVAAASARLSAHGVASKPARIAGQAMNNAMRKVKIADPILDTVTSPSITARETVEGLADIPVNLSGNEGELVTRVLADGTEQQYVRMGQRTEQSVESKIKRRESMLGAAHKSIDLLYTDYLRRMRGLGAEKKPSVLLAGVRAVTGTLGEGVMARPDFMLQTSRAMIRGDVSTIPEVQQLAKKLRSEFFQPLVDEAVSMGMFGWDLKPNVDGEMLLVPRVPDVSEFAESYMMRVYNKEKISANRNEFTDFLFQHFQALRSDAVKLAEADAQRVEQGAADIDFFRTALRDTLNAREDLRRSGRAEVDKAERARQRAGATAREAGAQSGEAGRRADATHAEELSGTDRAYYKGLQADVARGRSTQPPVTLLPFLRGLGGLLDHGGELSAIGANRINIVDSKGGVSLDFAAEAAAEAGYIGRRTDDGGWEGGTSQELLEAMSQEMKGSRIHSDDQLDLAQYEDLLPALDEALTEKGLSARDMSVEDFARFMDGRAYESATSFKKGKHTEALGRERFAGRRLNRAEERLEDAEGNLYDAQVLARTAREAAPELTEQANELRKTIRSLQTQQRYNNRAAARTMFRAEKTDDELAADVRATIDNILGGPEGRSSFDPNSTHRDKVSRGGTPNRAQGLSGRFKGRVLPISDVALEPWLEQDLTHILRSTFRSMVPDMELIKKFGDAEMTSVLGRINEEYVALSEALPDGSPARRKMDARRRETALNVMAMRDRLRGSFGMPDEPSGFWVRTARVLTQLNVLRLMGGVTPSSIPDVPRAVILNGFSNSLGPVGRAMTGDIRAWKKMTVELEDAGPGMEMVLNSRMLSMADVLDDFGRGSGLERAVTGLQGHFGMASLIAPWNNMNKKIAGFATQNRLLRIAEQAVDGGIKSKNDATWAAGLGYDASDIVMLGNTYREFGENVSGQRVANSRDWANDAVRERWLNAVRKEVDRVIVTPGLDKPLVASSPMGGVIFQFRSFNFASTQRAMMAYMQGMSARDTHAYMAFVAQIGLGMAVAQIKSLQNGVDTSEWSSRKWLAEGIDRSGVLGILTEANMLVDMASGGTFGLNALAGEGRMSRYQSMNRMQQMLGPSFGLVRDMMTVTGDLSAAPFADADGREEDSINGGTMSALRRITPYQNVFWLRGLFDQVQEASTDAVED